MTTVTGNGYTCSNCGVWVQNCNSHTCLSKIQQTYYASYGIINYLPILERIAIALEKIAENMIKK